MPDWTAVGRRKVAPSELRRDTVHAHGIALEAIAVAGARMMNERSDGWRESLRALRHVDWSRANSMLWEGRAGQWPDQSLANQRAAHSRAYFTLGYAVRR